MKMICCRLDELLMFMIEPALTISVSHTRLLLYQYLFKDNFTVNMKVLWMGKFSPPLNTQIEGEVSVSSVHHLPWILMFSRWKLILMGSETNANGKVSKCTYCSFHLKFSLSQASTEISVHASILTITRDHLSFKVALSRAPISNTVSLADSTLGIWVLVSVPTS